MLAPSERLLDLLARLGLALPAQVLGMRRRVRRLARGLPAFEMVWIDALVQARLLTPFQAAEIHAGRGEALSVGPFVLDQPLESLGYAAVFRARDTRRPAAVRLTLADVAPAPAAALQVELETLVRRAGRLTSAALAPIEEFGLEGGRVWTAGRDGRGLSAAEWLVRHGRLTPPAVLDIARQMLAALAVLEAAGVVHGDIRARNLILTPPGQAWLAAPGLRGILRPVESYANAQLIPEAFDGVAPERIEDGTRPTHASDLYACGTLWWQLLAGRPPIAGATGLARLRNTLTARIPDITELAPDTPPPLAALIAASLDRQPQRRPASMAEAAATLAPQPAPRRALARAVRQAARRPMHLGQAQPLAWWPRAMPRLVLAAGCALVLAIITWPQWGPAAAQSLAARLFPPRRAPAPLPAADAAPLAQNLPDTAIQLTSASVAAPPAPDAARPGAAPPAPSSDHPGPRAEILELPALAPLNAESLALSAGQIVRATPGRRSTLLVPEQGWTIAVENVRFENLDFVPAAGVAPAALVRVCAQQVAFEGCSFHGGAPQPSAAALQWTGPQTATVPAAPASRRLSLTHCFFDGVAAGVRCSAATPASFEAANTLHLGPGPFLVLDAPPPPGATLSVALERLTLRDALAMVECRNVAPGQDCGRLAITANDCALAPAAQGALLLFTGDGSPDRLLGELVLGGQGSVLVRRARVAAWRAPDGPWRGATEEGLQVEGVVRGELGFAGPIEAGPAASQTVRWQAPLRSTRPPGIRDDLPLLPGRPAGGP